MADEKPGVQILGQRLAWPETWPGMLTALSGLTAVVLTVAIFMIWSRQERVDQFTGLVIGVYTAKGEKSKTEDNVVSVFRFWTPNMHTKRDVIKDPAVPEDRIDRSKVDPWYWASDVPEGKALEPEVEAFMEELRLLLPTGVNLTSVVGVGTTNLKRGYVWEMTVSKTNPISRNQLLALYKRHWKREQDIWVQEQRVESTRPE